MTAAPIYLDYNATAPMRPDAMAVMQKLMSRPYNASAIHSHGREGRKHVEQARQHVAALVQCPPAQVIFNSGATEGNNTVLNHFKNDRILVSATEHVSVLDAAPNAERIAVLPNGLIDMDALDAMLSQSPAALVSVMLVNNETGVIQDIAEISKRAKNRGAMIHCDATQAAGRIPIDMTAMGIDFLTLSAHKIGGAQGVGALCLGLCGITPTLLHGGGQEKSARAGTENVAGIAAFGEAVKILDAEALSPPPAGGLGGEYQHQIESFITKHGGKIYSADAPRVSHTTLFSFPNLRAETALIALDLEGISISNGSACSSGSVKPSHVLLAMGADQDEAIRGLRVSTGWKTSQDDIDYFLAVFETFLKRKGIGNFV